MAADAALKSDIDDYYDEHLSELFLWFHQNPELGFLEQQTAARLASELRALGIDVTEGVGGTGLVGMIENGPGLWCWCVPIWMACLSWKRVGSAMPRAIDR